MLASGIQLQGARRNYLKSILSPFLIKDLIRVSNVRNRATDSVLSHLFSDM